MLKTLALLFFLTACLPVPKVDPSVDVADLIASTVRVDIIETVDMGAVKKGMTATVPHNGSGVVFMVKKVGKSPLAIDESLVLTAAHVCAQSLTDFANSAGDGPRYPVTGQTFSVTTVDGDVLPAEPVAAFPDPFGDVCVVRVLGKAGKPAQIADSQPPLGARVTHVGATWGIFGDGLAIVSDGRFCGIGMLNSDGVFDVLSLSTNHGSSGGGVFYNGKLVSQVLRVVQPSGDIAWGARLEIMKRIMQIGIEKVYGKTP